jgi:hypothetical protein
MWGQSEAEHSQQQATERQLSDIEGIMAGVYGRQVPRLEYLGEMMPILAGIQGGHAVTGQRALGEDIMGLMGHRQVQSMGEYRGIEDELNRGYGDLTRQGVGAGAEMLDYLAGGYGGLSQELQGRYQRRLGEGMGMLSGLGQQAGEDIQDVFTRRGAAEQQRLAQAGFGASTVGSNVARGLAEEESDAMSRLNEQLRREQLGVYTGMSGDLLGAIERSRGQALGAGERGRANLINLMTGLGGQELEQRGRLGLGGLELGMGLSGEAINAAQQFGQQNLATEQDAINRVIQAQMQGYMLPTDLDVNLSQNMAQMLAGVTHLPPDEATYLQSAAGLGQGWAPAPQPPGADWVTPLVGAGGAVAGAAIMSKVMFVVCLSGDSKVQTPAGALPLSAITVGDQVFCPDGKYRKVRFLDYGTPHPARANDYIEITTDFGSITLTKDHVIGGKPAGEWKVGETMQGVAGPMLVEVIQKVDAVPSGDLLLEGGDEYIAGGFVVTSMFSVYGVPQDSAKAQV